MSDALVFGSATADEERLVERRALETLVGFLALRWRRGWAAARTHCLVARMGDEVVSSVIALELPVHWPRQGGGTEIRMVAGVDSLVTPSRFRRRGYAGRLLEWVDGWAAEQGMAATALFSEIGTAYYRARGFRLIPLVFLRGPLPPPATSASRASGLFRPNLGQPFNSADLDGVAAAYSATAERHPLSVARDLDYWDYHLEHSRFVGDLHSDAPDPRDFTIADDERVAYVRSRSDGDIFTVLEAVCEPGAEDVLDLLLAEELARGAREGCLRVVLHLHPGARLPQVPDLRETSYETFLVRPTPEYTEGLDEMLAGAVDGARPYMFRPDYF